MPDVKKVYEMVTQQTPPKPDALERQRKRQMRHTMNRKLGAFAVAAAIAGLALLAVRSSIGDGAQQAATSRGTEPSPAPGVPEIDYVLDLNTGERTPLPEAIIRSQGDRGAVSRPGGYAATPDGSMLAYVMSTDNEEPHQIFIAGVDGTGARQMTHDPKGAGEPAWSPDGTMIAYVARSGSGNGLVNLLVLDVATGESTQIIDEAAEVYGPQFTPDGSSILYTDNTDEPPVLRTVPVTGGKSSPPFGALRDAENGSLSPDGSLVTFLSGQDIGTGGRRWVANADGTELRSLLGWSLVTPAGTWSPDGSRIVCVRSGGIVVIDVATRRMLEVAPGGEGAIWLDDHTLLIDV